MDADTLRSIESIGIILLGGLSIYLGYRLFKSIPQWADDQGRLFFPGGIKIYVNPVCPAVFFCLFGAAAVALSLMRPVEYGEEAAVSRAEPGEAATELHSLTKGRSGIAAPAAAVTEEQRHEARIRVEEDIAILNALPAALAADLPPPDRYLVEQAIPRVKFALMEPVWGEDWGDVVAFRDWAEGGARGAAPPGASASALAFFSYLAQGDPRPLVAPRRRAGMRHRGAGVRAQWKTVAKNSPRLS
jgi:hypothetical protein